jgi:MoxR-like ATPase
MVYVGMDVHHKRTQVAILGKTEVAKALSAALDRRLIRLQCYEGIDASQALYEWDYSWQLLAGVALRPGPGWEAPHGPFLCVALQERLTDRSDPELADRPLLAKQTDDVERLPTFLLRVIEQYDRHWKLGD